MSYGTDVSVFVEDNAGDLGAPADPGEVWWLSADIDIPAHPGQAVQGVNEVHIRVHLQEEPILDEKIVAEVYAGLPGLVLSPTSGTTRIDPGNLRFRPAGVAGTEPVANIAGGTLSFNWTPSSVTTDPGGPGHRCLVVRAFPESVTPPTSPFDVPNEQHEAQRNIEILETTTTPGSGGAERGDLGLWWQAIVTRAIERRGRRIVVWVFDPRPNPKIELIVRNHFGRRKFGGFSAERPNALVLNPGPTGEAIDPGGLLKRRKFVRAAGLDKGLFRAGRLLAAAEVELGPKKASTLMLGFDHSNLKDRTALVLHGIQWDGDGRAEGGITVVALAPTDR